MKMQFIWLLGVIIWNFGFPSAPPIADAIVAVLLSFAGYHLKYNARIKGAAAQLIRERSKNNETH